LLLRGAQQGCGREIGIKADMVTPETELVRRTGALVNRDGHRAALPASRFGRI
jgi:hypothetical protein